MTNTSLNPTRRETLAGIALCGATAVIAPAAALALPAPSIDRSDWNAALANYREADRQFEEAIARHVQAEELAGATCPRVDVFFDKYRLGMGTSRTRVVENLQFYNARNERANRIDVEAVADDFMAFQEKAKAARQRFCVDELDKETETFRPAFRDTREALMLIPAPDTAALLVKIETAFCSLDTDHADSALIDAKRLLSA